MMNGRLRMMNGRCRMSDRGKRMMNGRLRMVGMGGVIGSGVDVVWKMNLVCRVDVVWKMNLVCRVKRLCGQDDIGTRPPSHGSSVRGKHTCIVHRDEGIADCFDQVFLLDQYNVGTERDTGQRQLWCCH